MNKKKLEEMLSKKNETRTILLKRHKDSESIDEVRDLQSQIEEIDEEIRDLTTMLTDVISETPDSERTVAVTDVPVIVSTQTMPMPISAHQSRTAGDIFTDAMRDEIVSRNTRFTITAPEIRAANDPHIEGPIDGDLAPLYTEVDAVVHGANRRATALDLFAQGGTTSGAITYPVEGGYEGDANAVKEGGKIPQIKFSTPRITAPLAKIGAIIKESDEMIEDLPYLASSINNRLLYRLSLQEEEQVINGSGADSNMMGLLSFSGIMAPTYSGKIDVDGILKATLDIKNTTGLMADGCIVNPADYQEFRLSKDNNGQYYGGGPFAGNYVENGLTWELPLWGLNTVASPVVPKGTIIVGAFKLGAEILAKGGIRISMTNSDVNDFENGLIAVRAETRKLLKVTSPGAFAVITKA